MAKALVVISIVVAVAGVGVYYGFRGSPISVPEFDVNAWWGPEATKEKQDKSIRPFKIEFSDAVIKDLLERLSKRRKFTAPLEGVGFQYGFNSVYLEKVLDHWQSKYNFQKRQNFLNQYPQFKTNVQGLDIHFIHIKPGNEIPKGTKVVPLLMLHGWPGSVREFYEAIPYLSTFGQKIGLAFELIVPSLPGYGFSSLQQMTPIPRDGKREVGSKMEAIVAANIYFHKLAPENRFTGFRAAVRPGLGAAEVGVVMRNLMHRIGHQQFYVQGGDWGSIIGSHIATIFPKEVLGYHTNMPQAASTYGTALTLLGTMFPSLIVDSHLADRMYPLSKVYGYLIEETGYLHVQATKPDTVGSALNDSPSGLAAYILEKFSTWTNPGFKALEDGGLTKRFTLDQLVDNLMVYWISNSITTSMRLYSETFSTRHYALMLEGIPTQVPTAAIQARHELSFSPEKILKMKYPNLVHSKVLDDGGHFLAFELPQVFAEDLVKAVKIFETLKQ